MIAFIFLFTALFFASCGKEADFIVEKDGVRIEGKLKEGSSLSVESAKAKAESALSLSK